MRLRRKQLTEQEVIKGANDVVQVSVGFRLLCLVGSEFWRACAENS